MDIFIRRSGRSIYKYPIKAATPANATVTHPLLLTRSDPDPGIVGIGSVGVGSITVPSMLVVPGNGPGVVKVKAAQVTSAAAKVFVQIVSVGPVRLPCRRFDPSEEDPVQVAAVVPSRSHWRSAVLRNS